MTRKLVIDAFNAAIDKENPKEGLIFHSDRLFNMFHMIIKIYCGIMDSFKA